MLILYKSRKKTKPMMRFLRTKSLTLSGRPWMIASIQMITAPDSLFEMQYGLKWWMKASHYGRNISRQRQRKERQGKFVFRKITTSRRRSYSLSNFPNYLGIRSVAGVKSQKEGSYGSSRHTPRSSWCWIMPNCLYSGEVRTWVVLGGSDRTLVGLNDDDSGNGLHVCRLRSIGFDQKRRDGNEGWKTIFNFCTSIGINSA